MEEVDQRRKKKGIKNESSQSYKVSCKPLAVKN